MGTRKSLPRSRPSLGAAGFEIHVDQDVAGMVWSKLLINVGINALTAMLNIKNGQLLDYADVKSLMADLVTEAVAVAKGARRSPYL